MNNLNKRETNVVKRLINNEINEISRRNIYLKMNTSLCDEYRYSIITKHQKQINKLTKILEKL